jgi:hypothetical protein
VTLEGTVTDDGKPGGELTSTWNKQSGPGNVSFDKVNAAKTAVTLTGQGEYILTLTAGDGTLSASDAVTIVVEPFSARVTKTYRSIDDAYTEGGNGHNNQQLKVESNRRVAYLKFNVEGLPPRVLKATLKITANGDPGNGTLRVFRGSHSDWSENKLAPTGAPARKILVGEMTGSVREGQIVEIDVTPLVTGNGTHTAILTLDKGGNDIWFGSDESSVKPELIVTAEDPNG